MQYSCLCLQASLFCIYTSSHIGVNRNGTSESFNEMDHPTALVQIIILSVCYLETHFTNVYPTDESGKPSVVTCSVVFSQNEARLKE